MKKYFLLVILSCFISCQNEESKKTGTQSSGDEALIFARKIYGDRVNIILRGDINSNGKPDALAAIINKQLEEMKFRIERGAVIEKDNDVWKIILRMEDRVSTSKSVLTEFPEARDGYILSFSMEKNPVELKLSVSDARGQSSSPEIMLKWNEVGGVYEAGK